VKINISIVETRATVRIISTNAKIARAFEAKSMSIGGVVRRFYSTYLSKLGSIRRRGSRE
jgi:hypothetical protein